MKNNLSKLIDQFVDTNKIPNNRYSRYIYTYTHYCAIDINNNKFYDRDVRNSLFINTSDDINRVIRAKIYN